MTAQCKLFLLSGLLAAVLSAEEVLPNRDFAKQVNGVPVGWDFQQLKKKIVQYEVIPAGEAGPAAVKITVPNKDTQGFLTFRLRKNYQAGTKVTLSGEYRTENTEVGKDSIVLVNLVLGVEAWCVATAVTGQMQPFLVVLAAITVGNIAGLLPTTPSGVGTRDLFVIPILQAGGMTYDAALAVSLTITAIIILYNLSGGLFFILTPGRKKESADG